MCLVSCASLDLIVQRKQRISYESTLQSDDGQQRVNFVIFLSNYFKKLFQITRDHESFFKFHNFLNLTRKLSKLKRHVPGHLENSLFLKLLLKFLVNSRRSRLNNLHTFRVEKLATLRTTRAAKYSYSRRRQLSTLTFKRLIGRRISKKSLKRRIPAGPLRDYDADLAELTFSSSANGMHFKQLTISTVIDKIT